MLKLTEKKLLIKKTSCESSVVSDALQKCTKIRKTSEKKIQFPAHYK